MQSVKLWTLIATSCPCLSAADKYESFFPEFHFEVYQAAETLEKELTLTTDTYKAALKLFARLKSSVQTARQERVVANMKLAFVDFIQEKQPEFNWFKIVRVIIPSHLVDSSLLTTTVEQPTETAKFVRVPSELPFSRHVPAPMGDTQESISLEKDQQVLPGDGPGHAERACIPGH